MDIDVKVTWRKVYAVTNQHIFIRTDRNSKNDVS